ncbi:MAG: hypothetical protein HGB04_09045 [Chlorobiaceae bacterium]|nr:hypothetical protein [Chlorobiaceae bacterium]
MRHNRSPLPVFLFAAGLAALFSSCRPGQGAADPGPLYEEAARLSRQNKYPAALEAYNKALAVDTLKGFSRQAVDALLQKSRIEFMTGEYDAAFRTFGSLESHAGSMLPDSVQTAVRLSHARMHAELGEFGQAAAAIGKINRPGPWQRLQQAGLSARSGDFAGAARICGELAASDDPAVRIVALSGLLDCAIARSDLGLEKPDAYAGKIAAVSGKVMSMPAPPELRIKALRIAARSLRQLEKQHPNASFLLFRALAIAQQAGLSRLDQILQYESNEVIVRKPDTYRSTMEYFAQRNMPYARMASVYRLGMSPELQDKERIEVLKSGLQLGLNYGIPATARDLVRLEREAVGNLEELLIANGRYFELFEASEQAKLLGLQRDMQAGIGQFTLPAGHEALRNEIVRTTREITGLLQRKISMAEEGAGFEYSAPADKAIARKRGRLFELSNEAIAVDRGAASMLRLTPVTLMTVQKSLRPDQALVKLFVRDSLATGMLISSREMQIFSTPVYRDQLQSQLSQFRQSLASAGSYAWERMRQDPQRIWLTDILLQPMNGRLSGYRHLIFEPDSPMPFHLLGREEMLGADRRVSIIGSAKEAVVYAGQQPAAGKAPGIAFFDASRSDLAMVHKMYRPSDRVFLIWKPLSREESAGLVTRLSAQLKQDASGSGSLKALAGGQDGSWMYLSSYGID